MTVELVVCDMAGTTVQEHGAVYAALEAAARAAGADVTREDVALSTLGWGEDTVDAVVCADEVAAGRPAPYMIFRAMEACGVQRADCVAVAGDTVLDLRAGTNAGAAVVAGVLTGETGAEVLGAEPHTHLLASVADLPDVLR